MESSKRGYRVDTMLVILFTSRLRAAIVRSIIVFGHGTAHAVHTCKSARAHPLAIIFLGNNIAANNDIVMLMTKVLITKRNERSNISKTSASVSSGVPNTEKQMKARGRRPSAFIVSRCLEPLMKHEARVFEMASQTSVKISWNFFRRIGHQKV